MFKGLATKTAKGNPKEMAKCQTHTHFERRIQKNMKIANKCLKAQSKEFQNQFPKEILKQLPEEFLKIFPKKLSEKIPKKLP